MTIALFGGRFDPPHYGHLLVAEQVLEKMPQIDQVWLLPANTHPWKKMVAAASHRLNMTKFLEMGRIKVSDLDIKRGGQTYTIETIRILKKETANRYFWLCGSDTIKEFHRWKDFQELVKLIPFLVFPRSGHQIKDLPQGFSLIRNKNLITTSLSSTMVRERIKNGLSITGLVPEEVEEYIRKHNLYK
jgi:nicotinate-nucleotide adenylyltransferase